MSVLDNVYGAMTSAVAPVVETVTDTVNAITGDVVPRKNPETYDSLVGGDGPTATPGAFDGPNPRGVSANNPGATRKYSTNPDNATDKMARFLVPKPTAGARWNFISSVGDPDARELAKYVTTYGAQKNGMATAGTGLGYVDFLLQHIRENYEEKVQVTDVLSDNYVAYYFGSSPPVFQYGGKLLNTYQDDWRAAFTVLYRSVIRGTQLARRKSLVSLAYDNVVVTGSVMNMSQTLTSDMQMAADFQFSMLVKRYDVYRLPGTKSTAPGAGMFSVAGGVEPRELAATLRTGRVPRQFRTIEGPKYTTKSPAKSSASTAPASSILEFKEE